MTTGLPVGQSHQPESIPWKAASFYLPASAHLPVEVKLEDGSVEKREVVEGDWRYVVAWRSLKKRK